jgi:hypothetical protein
MLALPIRSQGLAPVARRNAQVRQPRAWFSKRSFLKATFWMSVGNRRLRRPIQINSVSGSAKPWIMMRL